MKKLTVLSLSVLFATAAAQTQVGQVTLTPVTPRPAPVKPPRASAYPNSTANSTASSPAPQPRATQVTQTKASTTYAPQQAPSGWYNLTGKVMTNGAVNLAAGSKVQLSLEELGSGNSLLKVEFGASTLPVPYQMYFNPAKLQAGKTYGVRAKVFNAQGVNIYAAAPTPLPTTKGSGVLDVKVNFVR